MKNPIVIFGVLALVVLVAVVAAVSMFSGAGNEPAPSEDRNDNQQQDIEDANGMDEGETFPDFLDSLPEGEYKKYSEAGLTSNTNILFFYASWCPTCNALDRNINQNVGEIPNGVTIFQVPYDSASGATQQELDLKRQYGVTYQHTLVQVDESGQQIKKWTGSPSLSSILENL